MIIEHTIDESKILFNPENDKERKILDKMPGFSVNRSQFYCPSKAYVLFNLYTRLLRKGVNCRVMPLVKSMIEEDMVILDIPESFSFFTKPLPHQLLALRFAYTFRCFGLLLEP